MIRVRLSELELSDLGDDIWEELEPRAMGALIMGRDKIIDAAKQNLRRRIGTKRTAAPAGESPEYDTGELERSVKAFGIRRTKYSMRAEYGSEHPAAGLHEWGGSITRNGVRRAYPPRPYIRPAEAATQDEVEQLLENL